MFILLIALIFFLLLIGCMFWHIQQNRKLFQRWQQYLDRDTARGLNDFAWSRSLQLWSALGAAVIASLLVYAMEMQNSNQMLLAANKNMQDKLEQFISVTEQTNTPEPNSQLNPTVGKVDVTAQAVPLETSHDMNVLAPASSDPTGSANVNIADIYAPEETADDDQSTMDVIKRRYESLLVNYLFLKKCGLINANDYHTIISTLTREMSAINAPSRLEHDILTAAKGSYNEMYAQSACEGQEIASLHKQYADYISTISSNIPE